MEYVFARMDARAAHEALIKTLNSRGIPARAVRVVEYPNFETLFIVRTWSGNEFHYTVADAWFSRPDKFKSHLHEELDNLAKEYKAKHYPKTPLPFAEEKDSMTAEEFRLTLETARVF